MLVFLFLSRSQGLEGWPSFAEVTEGKGGNKPVFGEMGEWLKPAVC